MGRAVQHLIPRVQHLPGRPPRGLQAGQQQRCVDHRVADGRQDVVMKVQFQTVQGMAHRRHLVTPLVVVLAIVLVQFSLGPAGVHQAGLRVGDVLARDQDVHIRRQATGSDGQVLPDVSGALEQDQRVVHCAQLGRQSLQSPQQVPRTPSRILHLAGQVAGNRLWHLGRQAGRLHALGQSPQQTQTPGQANHALPLWQGPHQTDLRVTKSPQPTQA